MPKYTLTTPEQIKTAKLNGIPEQTLRNRLRAGWEIQKAVTEPPRKRGERKRNEHGLFIGKNKADQRAFRLTKDLDRKLAKAIKESGLNQSDFLAEIVAEWLEKN